MDEELERVLAGLDQRQTRRVGGRDLHEGRWQRQPVVAVRSGVGKVAAAATATILLTHARVRALVFSGVAGGLAPGVRVGDWVLAEQLMQHDLDASPIFPRWEVPYSGRSRFATDTGLNTALAEAALAMLAETAAQDPAQAAQRAELGITHPQLHRGLIVSGDRFIHGAAERARLQQDLPDALAVEMEGAAVAQVAFDFGCPLAVLRLISDQADDAAAVDFGRFVQGYAAEAGERLLRTWMAGLDPESSA
jgi:adenosylhomocysteine nucleosidase